MRTASLQRGTHLKQMDRWLSWCLCCFLVMKWLLRCEACTDKDVRHALVRCNAQLADVSGAILAEPGNNFTQVCGAFRLYVLCVEPQLTGCQSVLMHQFEDDKGTYSSAPYNCPIPPWYHVPPPHPQPDNATNASLGMPAPGKATGVRAIFRGGVVAGCVLLSWSYQHFRARGWW